jgi:hypothetical protein
MKLTFRGRPVARRLGYNTGAQFQAGGEHMSKRLLTAPECSRKVETAIGFVLALSMLAGCDRTPEPATEAAAPAASRTTDPADAVYRNGRIYTGNPEQPWAAALAVKDGRLLVVGDAAAVDAVAGPGTRTVDLGGRMVMPGIIDTHVHPMDAGRKELLECGFPFTLGMDEVLARVRDCAAALPAGAWVRGGQWSSELLGAERPPQRALLDAVAPDHPVFLMDSTVHNAWLNSKALAALGIDRDSVAPRGGTILKDGAGEPTGILLDKAAYEAMRQLPAFAPGQYLEAIVHAVRALNAVGVTGMKDAQADHATITAYRDAERAGALTMHVAASMPWKNSWTETHDQELQHIAARAQSATDRIDNDFIKMFLDGIPPTRTAAFLEPYLPDAAHPHPDSGTLNYTPEELAADVTTLDAQGLTIKIHATGDRSVRVALDAFAQARAASGSNARRHEVAHAEAISAADIPRFAALNVTAEMSPILWYPSPLVATMEQVLGAERVATWWPIRSLLATGARVTYGSDWPSVVPSPSPWPGIEAMVTRADPYGVAGGVHAPEQAIGLDDALRIFTLAGAEALYLEEEIGILAPGKRADFIVLDRNLFGIPPDRIGDTQVLLTVFEGQEVYRAARAAFPSSASSASGDTSRPR